LIAIGFIFLLILPLISAVEVVQVEKPTEQKQGFFASTFSFLKSPIFWGILVLLILVVGFIIGAIFFVSWLVKFLKQNNDIFYKLRKERIAMAKTHRRYNSKHWLKVHKNTPIRLVKKEENNLIISKPIGYHRGDYTTHEGNVIIALNLIGNKQFFFVPITDVLVIPNKAQIEILEKIEKQGKKVMKTINNLPQAKDIIRFNEDEILIFAESLSRAGYFVIPVLKTKDGKIIDLSLPTFQSLKNVVIGDYLFQQTADFGSLARKGMDINPFIRASQKVADSNQNVEIQDTTLK